MNSVFRSLMVLAVSVMIGCMGCKPDEQVNCDFDQTGMLTNYAENLIIPAFIEMNLGNTLLKGSIDLFVSDPNTANLVEARIAWLAAYKAYQRTSMFAFGPAVIDGAPFFERFNTYPTDDSGIEAKIAADEVLTSGYSVALVGYPAIEYLVAGNGSQTDLEVVDAFIADPSRGQYLSSLAGELLATSTAIKDDWTAYQSTFVANTGTADGSSESLLINAYIQDFEIKKNFAFKIPLGKFNGGMVLPEQCEAFFSGYSAELASEQMKASARAYAGMSSSGANGLGLDDHLDCLKYGETDGVYLFTRIVSQYDEIEVAVDAIPDPMSETLISDKPVVDDAHTLMQQLVPMIKRDLTAAIGIQISYVDSDGD